MTVVILQYVMVSVASVSLVGGACAFLFVIWPSIRNAERRGARMEAWFDGPDAKKVVSALKTKLGLEAGGSPSSKEAFLRESTSGDTTDGVTKL
jgi:hypothetical protein